MNDNIDNVDTRIRRAVAELVDAAPLPPSFDRIVAARRTRHRRRLVLVVPLAVAAAVVALVARNELRSPVEVTTEIAPSDRSIVPAPKEAVWPTRVAPSKLPAGLELADAARDTTRREPSGSGQLEFWSGDFARSGLVSWSPSRGGCRSSPVAQSQREAIERFRDFPEGSSLQWCDSATGLHVGVSTHGMPSEDAAELARRVHARDGSVTVALPEGFRGVEVPGVYHVIALRYEGRTLAGKPQLHVRIDSAGPFELERRRAQMWERRPRLATLGGRPALETENAVIVLYDDRTLVTLSGDGLSREDVFAAAESLVARNDIDIPSVTSDPAACDRLRICG